MGASVGWHVLVVVCPLQEIWRIGMEGTRRDSWDGGNRLMVGKEGRCEGLGWKGHTGMKRTHGSGMGWRGHRESRDRGDTGM